MNLTPAEAVAMALALQRMGTTPFRSSAGSALRKLVAAMQQDDAAAAQDLSGRILLLGSSVAAPPERRVLADAVSIGRVLRITYGDRDGISTTRDIEPQGYAGTPSHWYLLGWCRLRGALRVFRTDRIVSAHPTAEVVAPRAWQREDLDIPYGPVHQLSLT